MTKEEFFTGLEDIPLKGRDDFYTRLMWQEFPHWMDKVANEGKVDPEEVKWLVERRDFNSLEANRLAKLAFYLEKNSDIVKSICEKEFLKAHEWEIEELKKIQIVVEKESEPMITTKNAIFFAKKYHMRQIEFMESLIQMAVEKHNKKESKLILPNNEVTL